MKKPHSNAYYTAREHYQEISARAGAGKGGRYRSVDRRKWDEAWKKSGIKYWWEKKDRWRPSEEGT